MRILLMLACLAMAACSHAPLEPPNAANPLPGLMSAAQPDRPTFEALAARGYTSVVDLRRPSEDRGLEEQEVVEGLGMSYLNIPVDGKDGITWENASALDRALREAPGPVLVHCGSSNRVGALIALRAKMAGASDEEALALGREAGLTGLEDTVRQRLSEQP